MRREGQEGRGPAYTLADYSRLSLTPLGEASHRQDCLRRPTSGRYIPQQTVRQLRLLQLSPSAGGRLSSLPARLRDLPWNQIFANRPRAARTLPVLDSSDATVRQ